MVVVRYMLRRVIPEWKAKDAIEELCEYCKKNHIDEVLCIPESPGAYKELRPIEEIKKWVPILLLTRKKLDEIGVAYSINVVTTIGHGDYGGEGEKIHPGMEFMVDYTGVKSRFCACPLSPVWQEWVKEEYRLYASTRPVCLWIDDDFRYYNHLPVRYSCYCNRHIEEFSKRVGEELTREKLVNAILSPGSPHPLRKKWFQFLEETLLEIARMLKETVHNVSPETQLCWMSSTPYLYELEGRNPGKQIKSLIEKTGSAIRMATTQYYEGNPRLLLIEEEALKKVIPLLPEGTIKCTEIESMPHSIYVKSANWIASQISWACVLGVVNHTLNLYDFLGTPMKETPLIAEMLRERKKKFNAIAKASISTKRFRGIGLLSHPYSVHYVHTTKGETMEELMVRETGWADVLRGFGIPVVCERDEGIVAVTGQAFRCLTEDEIKRVFSRGVILDLSALQTLEDMGFGKLAGVKVKDIVGQRSRWIGPERLVDPAFGGGKDRFTWTYAVSSTMTIGVIEPYPEAMVISHIVDPDLKFLFNGVVLYENELGGRVATFPYNFSGTDPDIYIKGATSFFYGEYRKQQIHSIVRWLGRGDIPLMVHANGWVLPHRADGEKNIILAAMNLNYDTWKEIKMEGMIKKKIKKVYINFNDRWRELNRSFWKQEKGYLRVKIKRDIPTFEVVMVNLYTEG